MSGENNINIETLKPLLGTVFDASKQLDLTPAVIISKPNQDQILTLQTATKTLEVLTTPPKNTAQDKDIFIKDISLSGRSIEQGDLGMLRRAQAENHLADILAGAVKLLKDNSQTLAAAQQLVKAAKNSLYDCSRNGEEQAVNFAISIQIKTETGKIWQGHTEQVDYTQIEQGLKKASELLKTKGIITAEEQKTMDETVTSRINMAREIGEGKQASISSPTIGESLAMTDLPQLQASKKSVRS